jgi:TonB family protein
MPGQEIDKVLKVGLVQDGRLIEDTVLQEKQGVTIGQDPSNTFSVTEPNVPRRHQLLEFTGQGYRLVMLENMKGRLLIGDNSLELSELVQTGKARKTPRGYEYDLESRAKGKISIGRTTLLFQLIPPPPPAVMLKLPKELKSNFLKSVDLAFMIVLLVSTLVHASVILYINSIPLNESEAMPVPERFVQEIATEDVVIPTEQTTPEKTEPGHGGGGGGGHAGAHAARGAESYGVVALLTREGSNGTVGDLLQSGVGNLDQTLAGIGGVRVGRAGDQGAGTRGGTGGGTGSGNGVGIGDIGSMGGGGTVGTGQRAEKKVTANMESSTGGISGKIDAAQVRSIIRSRIAAIRQCYELQLKVNPSLKGTVRISFTIDNSGNVSNCSVMSDTTGNGLVADCVCRRVMRWRFPQPEEGTVTVPQTFVFTPVD